MKGVKLTERIRYLHCEGEEGAHGILVLLGLSRFPTRAIEIESQADFRKFYAAFASAERLQGDLLKPREQFAAV